MTVIPFSISTAAIATRSIASRRLSGPGLKGILKRPTLPVSGRPATPENVYRQLREPYKNMPSFAQKLTDDDVFNLIAFLNTR